MGTGASPGPWLDGCSPGLGTNRHDTTRRLLTSILQAHSYFWRENSHSSLKNPGLFLKHKVHYRNHKGVPLHHSLNKLNPVHNFRSQFSIKIPRNINIHPSLGHPSGLSATPWCYHPNNNWCKVRNMKFFMPFTPIIKTSDKCLGTRQRK